MIFLAYHNFCFAVKAARIVFSGYAIIAWMDEMINNVRDELRACGWIEYEEASVHESAVES
jgi:hypothetical protein